MQSQEVRVTPDWFQQFAGLVILILGTAVYLQQPKPQKAALPAVQPVKPVKPVNSGTRLKKAPSPEVMEFMALPPQTQKQALEYARSWIDANFEKED